MQTILSQNNHHILSIARGEEVFEELLSWSREQKVAGAAVTGIGAASRLEIAYYNLAAKSFERQIIEENVEIVSLTGSIGRLKRDPALHLHGVFSRRDFSTLAGHLFSIHISGACELHVISFDHPLNRAYDEETGLNLLTCENV